MYNDMPTKDDRIHLRVEESIKNEFEAVAILRGLKLSALIHNLLVELVNQEKSERPELFTDALRKIKQPERKAHVLITAPGNVADAGTLKPARKASSQRKIARKR